MKNILIILVLVTSCSTTQNKNLIQSAQQKLSITPKLKSGINRIPTPKPGNIQQSLKAPPEIRIKTEAQFRIALRELVSDFLNGQIKGESITAARVKYGADGCKMDSFNNVIEYSIVDFDEKNGINMFFRAKEKGRGELTWRDYQVVIVHYPEIERTGEDKYLGLRIAAVNHPYN